MTTKRLPPFFPRWPGVRPFLWGIFGIWTALLFYATSQPGSPGLWPEFPQADKVLHFLFFACGAMACGAALRATFHGPWTRLFLIVVVTLATLGLADEINQLRIPGRSGADPFDWLADLSGTVGGLLLLRSFYGRKKPAGYPGADSRPPGTDSPA